MPTYRVTTPDGQKLDLTADSPPTEQELEEVFASQSPKASALPPPTDLSKLPSDEAIENLVRGPQSGHPLARFGEGVQQQLGKFALGARQSIDKAIANVGQPRPSGSIGSMLEGVGLLPSPQDVEYDPGEYAQVRDQHSPRGMVEGAGQLGPSLASALALGGGAAGTGTTLGTGLATELESGSPEQGAIAGLTSAIMGPLTAKGIQYTAGVKFAHIQGILRAAKMAAGAAAGASLGGPAGGALGAVLTSMGATARSTKKLYDYIKNDQINNASRMLWKLLPPAAGRLGADTTTEPSYDTTEKLMNADSPKALADIARKRQQAENVLR
jgi:hypothetical protein